MWPIHDLSRSWDNLIGFVKTRGSLVPNEEFVFWWSGRVYSFVDANVVGVTSPEECRQRQLQSCLFAIEGFNIGRMQPIMEERGTRREITGWRLLAREVTLYKDPETSAILHKWWNPFTHKKCDVVQVANDPVNHELRQDGFQIPFSLIEDEVVFNLAIQLSYPNPLPPKQYPQYSAAELYQAAELFNFYVSRDDLFDNRIVNSPCTISWSRVGPWLPWMRMGVDSVHLGQTGKLIYHCHGKKLQRGTGFANLPDSIREYVGCHMEEKFQSAPTAVSGPNTSSWTYFKRLLNQHNS